MVPAHCVDVALDPALSAVSPEGELWAVQSGNGRTEITVLSPEAGAPIEIPFATTAVSAWATERATLTGDSGLWTYVAGNLQPLPWPDSLPAPADFCGDPTQDADSFVVADGLFRRDAGRWWQWSMADFAGRAPQIASTAAACWGTAQKGWLRLDTNVFSIESDWIGRVEALEPSDGLAFDDTFGAASIVDGDLVVGSAGEGFERVRFEAGPVASVSAAPGALWVAAGPRTYLLRDGEYLEAVDARGAIASHWASAYVGGAWTWDGAEACRRAVDPSIRVRGLRPYEHRNDGEIAFEIEVEDPDGDPHVTLDGATVPSLPLPTGAWSVEATVDTDGWHSLTVVATSGGTEATRELPFSVVGLQPVTWSADIEPLFAEHCSGGACHGPEQGEGSQPDLSSYQAWVDNAAALASRVVQTGDMPQLAARLPTWGADEVVLVSKWLDGQMPQ